MPAATSKLPTHFAPHLLCPPHPLTVCASCLPPPPPCSIGEVCAERRAIFSRLAAVEVPDPADGLRAMQHATATWLKVRR